jgi:hypothetical protein
MACGAANLGSKQIVQYQADYILESGLRQDQERTLLSAIGRCAIDHSMPLKCNTLS